jgi:hypothetical protein
MEYLITIHLGWTFEKNDSNRVGFELREEKFWRGTNFIELLSNPNGKKGLESWAIVENGGDGFIVGKYCQMI